MANPRVWDTRTASWTDINISTATGILPVGEEGCILIYTGGAWVALAPGNDGQVLMTQGAGDVLNHEGQCYCG